MRTLRQALRQARRGAALVVAVLLTAATSTASAAATNTAPAAATSPQGQGAVVAAIDTFLASQIQESGIPGAAVAVTRGNRVLMVRGYGHDSTGTAVTSNSLFRIASLSKSFTALAVMQLVDAGLPGPGRPGPGASARVPAGRPAR